jgi:hypothetical protein
MPYLRRLAVAIDALLTLRRVTFYPLALVMLVATLYGGYLVQTRAVNGGLSAAGYGARMIGGSIVRGGAAALLLAAGFGPLALRSAGSGDFTVLYAATILMTVIITPHVLVYDGVVLFIPALILLDKAGTSPAVRVSCLAAYALTWLFPLHNGLLGVAPWTFVPLTALLLVARRLLLKGHTRALQAQEPVLTTTTALGPG